MTQHQDIQDPKTYTEEDYQRFQQELSSPLTERERLEEICMTLAHLPTKEAQDLLAEFETSERAAEVSWLECAMEEGEFHYMSPMNVQEERDYLALKMVQEMWDETIELEIKRDELQLELDKREIEHEAVQVLVAAGELDNTIASALHDLKIMLSGQIAELNDQISTKEKIYEQIKRSIKTERYRTIDPFAMRHVHFC